MARLSNIESDASDLQTAVDTLRVNTQDVFKNAEVVEGQAVLGGVFLNKIGTKDNTLVIETRHKVIELRVDKDVTQEKQTPAQDANGSKVVLSGTTVRGRRC